MRRMIRGLFTSRDPLTGGAYFGWGLLLFVLKYALDAALVKFGFGSQWRPTDYFLPRDGRIRPGVDVPFTSAVMLIALALPFIWIGVNLTIRRLRTVGWPALLACFFFIPYVNFLFFAALVFKAARDPGANIQPPHLKSSRNLKVGAVVVAGCFAFAAITTEFFKTYGWGLFVGIPFCTGFIPMLVAGDDNEPSFRAGFTQMMVVQSFVAICLLMFSLEGIICIVMAAPISIGVGLIGVTLAYIVRSVPPFSGRRSEIACVSFLLLPLIILGEAGLRTAPTLFEVTSRVKVDAPAERVWNSVVTFSNLPPATEFIFRAGVAYPIRAEIKGAGVGAVRHCVFSTGPFVEPITVWDEPRLLRFSVTSNPPPMKELSIAPVHPPHLSGFLESEQGQFELLPTPDGGTELVGTTWYRHGLWPEAYWRIWSDHIIHTIHLRVLQHIKAQAEGTTVPVH